MGKHVAVSCLRSLFDDDVVHRQAILALPHAEQFPGGMARKEAHIIHRSWRKRNNNTYSCTRVGCGHLGSTPVVIKVLCILEL